MNKDVLITISSTQNVDGSEDDAGELITLGTYSYGKDGIRFSYMESEVTGLDGTKTVFHIKPDEVVLSHRGSVNANMVFHPGRSSNFLYSTEYGMLRLGLDTRRLECAMDEHGGRMEVEYDLDFQRSFVSRNKFKIEVREKDAEA